MESFILASLIKEIHFLFLLSECQTSQVIKPLIAHMSRQGVSIAKINGSVLKCFNKDHSDCDNICEST